MPRVKYSALAVILLRAQTPCCSRPVRFRALVDAPRESYERSCSACGARWMILREFLKDSRGIRLDKLDWTCERGVGRPSRFGIRRSSSAGPSVLS